MTPLVGLSLVPEADRLDGLRALAQAADAAGLDLLGIQDHPYQQRFADTWMLMADLLARTERLRVFPDVANLPLRPPAVMAKAAATLDLLSGGRFELGLGAGAFWDGVAAMGGARRAPGEAVDALEEAIAVIRLMWSGEGAVRFDGRHYRLEGVHPGPAPAHDVGIWLGAYKPRMLRLVGRAADGWVPSLGYADVDALRAGNARIDEAAAEAGRDPRAIRRILNVSGTITGDAGAVSDGSGAGLGGGPSGPPAYWQERLAELAALGFDGFVFWPTPADAEQVERLARVAEGLRAAG
jgi:alkanesulfonate monooxygenase SsuD/methylene tetrahydromethanopterin reductase-like flavin-dependent oxidoreductase (luciferase family)